MAWGVVMDLEALYQEWVAFHEQEVTRQAHELVVKAGVPNFTLNYAKLKVRSTYKEKDRILLFARFVQEKS